MFIKCYDYNGTELTHINNASIIIYAIIKYKHIKCCSIRPIAKRQWFTNLYSIYHIHLFQLNLASCTEQLYQGSSMKRQSFPQQTQCS